MRGRAWFCTLLLCGCDSVDVGRNDDPASAPLLIRIMIQDEDRNGGRNIVSDLFQVSIANGGLDATPPAPCNDSSQCRVEELERCENKLCFQPFSVAPAVGRPVSLGGNQIRLVFDQGLDSGLDAEVQAAGQTVISLADANGPLETSNYLDPSGSFRYTAVPLAQPFGPALVMKPLQSLFAGTTYTIRIDPARIRDRDGFAATLDAQGPIRAEYQFKTADLELRSALPDVRTLDTPPLLSPNDVLQFFAEAPLSEQLDPPAEHVVVKNSAGVVVPAIALHHEAGDAPYGRSLIVVRTSSGTPVDWARGDYTITLHVPSPGPGSDAFLDLEGAFTVEGPRSDPADDPLARENFQLTR